MLVLQVEGSSYIVLPTLLVGNYSYAILRIFFDPYLSEVRACRQHHSTVQGAAFPGRNRTVNGVYLPST